MAGRIAAGRGLAITYKMQVQQPTKTFCNFMQKRLAKNTYPLMDGDREETIFNMVNTMLLRIHQSGHLVKISQERFDLVKEGITCYKQMWERCYLYILCPSGEIYETARGSTA